MDTIFPIVVNYWGRRRGEAGGGGGEGKGRWRVEGEGRVGGRGGRGGEGEGRVNGRGAKSVCRSALLPPPSRWDGVSRQL